jgi:hypothetical protein
VRAELARRARGGDEADAVLSHQMVQAITRLAIACVQAGLDGTRLPSETESAVAQLKLEAAGPLQPWPHLPLACQIHCSSLSLSFAIPSATPERDRSAPHIPIGTGAEIGGCVTAWRSGWYNGWR